ncbi:uncharacterized protein PG998_013887, partial [Apiospora kogelbergensis]|uniref:uncharacterized protein n=1 Tax=Apiospora kogelbergensis TaxID=1337665 RepID=UPI00312D1777
RFPESGSLVHGFTCDWRSSYRKARRETRRFLSSKAKHWVILALVALDVAGILSDIFIALITCELKMEDKAWVQPTRSALTNFSLVMSCLFLLELLLCLWAEGIRYLSSWFHCFDAFVIVGSFVIDLLEHGIAEEIASLIVILRLWRFVKIANELSVEASEQIEGSSGDSRSSRRKTRSYGDSWAGADHNETRKQHCPDSRDCIPDQARTRFRSRRCADAYRRSSVAFRSGDYHGPATRDPPKTGWRCICVNN